MHLLITQSSEVLKIFPVVSDTENFLILFMREMTQLSSGKQVSCVMGTNTMTSMDTIMGKL